MSRRYTLEERREILASVLLYYSSDPFPSFSGACHLAGVVQATVMNWLKKDPKAFSEYLKAKGASEAHWLKFGQSGKNPVFGIFALKTQHGESYTERVGVDVREWKFEGDKNRGKPSNKKGKI